MDVSQLSLGQRIKHYRNKADLSQKDLAAIVGISPTVFSRYESDKLEPNILTLMNLAKALNITGDALLGLSPHPDLIAQNRDEYTVLRTFRSFNSLGQNRTLEYISGVAELPKYTEKK
ncbi:MAG: helix-turn-helix domain-containing protein [Chitinispirillia bacterium]|nr:helix-turn-helix domain-containing protein [Chitinispirillia bacterium]